MNFRHMSKKKYKFNYLAQLSIFQTNQSSSLKEFEKNLCKKKKITNTYIKRVNVCVNVYIYK